MRQPCLLIRDPDIIKQVLITDYSKFGENDFHIDKEIDPLTAYNPFFLVGDEWKRTRGYFTPTLTVNKLKNYFEGMLKVSKRLENYILDHLNTEGNVDFDAKELLGKYTTDVVANTIFGVENNTFTNKNSLFYKLTSELFEDNLWANIKTGISVYFPELSKILRIKFISAENEKILIDTVKKTIELRKTSNIERKDFIQQAITLSANDTSNIFTDKFIASMAFSFIGDGYETSGTALSFALIELAWDQRVQEKLRKEIDDMMNEAEDDLSYEKIIKLDYLEMVFRETLRMHPPAGTLLKLCTSDSYVLPPQYENGKPVTIDKGTPITLSVLGLHRDPKYYDNPDTFYPERFLDGMDKYKGVYLPFGDGPRICIGMRFATAQVKTAIATLIHKFHLELSPGTKYPIMYDKQFFLVRPSGNTCIRFIKRK